MLENIFKNISLRIKVLVAFIVIVIGGTAISTLIGSRIITGALLDQVHNRVQHGLEAARLVYTDRLDCVRRVVEQASLTQRLVDAVGCPGTADKLPGLMSLLIEESGLDFMSYVDRGCGFVSHGAGESDFSSSRDCSTFPEPIRSAMLGNSVSSTEIVDHEFLLEECPDLARRAQIEIVPVSDTTPGTARAVDSGLVLITAVPVRNGDEIIGVIYGGILLNRRYEIVDRVKQIVYGGEKYQGRDVGTVTIFMRDVGVSTNVTTRPGKRAVGTRVSDEVVQAVLDRGEQWYERALVVDDWYVTAYEPIRNNSGSIIGILYVGMLEKAFLAARTQMMLTFLVVAVIGIMVVLILTYIFTRSMILPLEEMVTATKRIAEGDLDQAVKVHSRDEIGYLAVNFNKMLASLRSMKGQLQDWAHTLEEKVEARTEELMVVQAQMAQTEKLASLGRLSAGVAHEINNPLGGIMTFSMTALEDCGTDHPMHETLETIAKQAMRCREIVKGLLDFARQSETSASLVETNPVVDNTLSLLEKQAMFHNIETLRNLQQDLPLVFIDPYQLQQVIMNIVLNAVDAMEESGRLTVETERDEEAGEVLIRISDTGKGIPDEVMPYIFEPFYTTKEVGQGTGLGLAIVHGVINRAGGRIDVTSSKSGTTFTVRLTAAPSPYGKPGRSDPR